MNKMVIPIAVIIASFSLMAVFTTLDSETRAEPVEIEQNESVLEPTTIPEHVSVPMQPQTGLGFSVNVSGDMHDKSFFTVSGTIPDSPNHLTGTVRTGEGDSLRILYVFQIELDESENRYEEKVGINSGYLWEEDTTYIVSVNHGETIKEVEFYRGTTGNDFRDSVIPVI